MNIEQKPIKSAVAVIVYPLITVIAGCSPESSTTHSSRYGPSGESSDTAGASVAGQGSVELGIAGDPAAVETEPFMEGAAVCAAVVHEAQLVEVQVPTEVEVEVVTGGPVALYIMLDQSSSMLQPTPTDLLIKWQVAVDSLTTFVNDPLSEDLDIALQYFPQGNGQCTGEGYDTPVVPIGELPEHAPNIAGELANHTPMTIGTPIEGALRGATAFCARFQEDPEMNPDGKQCVAVLVTDGVPTVCNGDFGTLTSIAGDAYNNNGVMTFAIGMNGANFDLLDQIAEAGNADCTPNPGDPSWSCNVSTGDTTFLDALDLIRTMVTRMETRTQLVTQLQTQTVDCNWEIPPPPEGEEFDRDKVNVVFSTGQDADKKQFRRVDSKDACLGKLGWYYDDPNNPTRIIACEYSCSVITEAAENAKVDILFGCETLIF